MKSLIRRQEAAVMLGVSLRTLARWEKAGLLRSRKVGPRLVRYEEKDLRKLLKRGEGGGE